LKVDESWKAQVLKILIFLLLDCLGSGEEKVGEHGRRSRRAGIVQAATKNVAAPEYDATATHAGGATSTNTANGPVPTAAATVYLSATGQQSFAYRPETIAVGQW
jgi:hypothetical protein